MAEEAITQTEVGTENNDENITSGIEESSTVGISDSEISGDNTNDENEIHDSGPNAENAKKRIDSKSRKLQRRIDELESRLSSFESYRPQAETGAQMQPPMAPTPNPESVVDPITGEYLTPGTGRYDAVLLQQQQQYLAQHRQQQQQQQEAMYYQKQQEEKFFDALDDAAERYEDFDDVVRNDNLPLTEAMLGVAKVTPNGADLLYYLAKNPKEVQRISRLHPLLQQQEMAKHAIQFAAKNTVSKAPAPVQPVGDTPGSSSPNSFNRVVQNTRDLKNYYREKERRGRR